MHLQILLVFSPHIAAAEPPCIATHMHIKAQIYLKNHVYTIPVSPDDIFLFTNLHQVSGNPPLLLTLSHQMIDQDLTSM